jgi:hypothetical protein
MRYGFDRVVQEQNMNRVQYDEGCGKTGVVGAGHAREPFFDRGHGPLLHGISDFTREPIFIAGRFDRLRTGTPRSYKCA